MTFFESQEKLCLILKVCPVAVLLKDVDITMCRQVAHLGLLQWCGVIFCFTG